MLSQQPRRHAASTNLQVVQSRRTEERRRHCRHAMRSAAPPPLLPPFFPLPLTPPAPDTLQLPSRSTHVNAFQLLLTKDVSALKVARNKITAKLRSQSRLVAVETIVLGWRGERRPRALGHRPFTCAHRARLPTALGRPSRPPLTASAHRALPSTASAHRALPPIAPAHRALHPIINGTLPLSHSHLSTYNIAV